MWGGFLVAITMAIHGTGMYRLAQDFQDTQLKKRRDMRQGQGHPT
jgi:hypothetical protein